MTTLVLGDSGFLGGAVAAQLRQTRDVVGVSRSSGDRRCDIGTPDALWSLLEAERPATIVNCAVVADFGPSVLASLYPVNVLAVAVLGRWCAMTGAHLVHASATLVHGARTTRIDDDTPIAADTDYGISKLLGEQVIAASGCDAAVLRFGGLFGRGGPRHLGLNVAIDRAAAGERPQLAGTGAGRRNYLHVVDAARVIEFACDERTTGTHRAAGADVLSIREMLEQVCDVFGITDGPDVSDGGPGNDQVIVPSPTLPEPRSFRAAVEGDR